MINKVKIIGLGLMGANLGINLKSKGIDVFGQDVDKEAENRAEKFGIDTKSKEESYDVTVLSMPINNIVSFLSECNEIDDSKLLIDIGGTKESICNLMDSSKIPSIGGHPLCGLADNRIWEPTPEMYDDATFLLCETESMNDNSKKIARDLVNILNCKEVWIDRKKHDEILSITSHLPHLISSALVGIAKKDYEIDEKDKNVFLTNSGISNVEKILNEANILKNNKRQKIFHFARFDVAVFKFNFKIIQWINRV